MTKKKNVWVTKRPDNKWNVRSEGSNRPSKVTDTQKEAINAGKEQAKNQGVDLIVQGRDGRIRSRDSYGNDPNPPKDTEH